MFVTSFQVDPDALLDAAEGVSSSAELLRSRDISAIDPSTDHIGDPDLAAAFSDFTERWQTGVQHLLGDADQFVQRLNQTVTAYLGIDAQVAETIRAIGGGS